MNEIKIVAVFDKEQDAATYVKFLCKGNNKYIYYISKVWQNSAFKYSVAKQLK